MERRRWACLPELPLCVDAAFSYTDQQALIYLGDAEEQDAGHYFGIPGLTIFYKGVCERMNYLWLLFLPAMFQPPGDIGGWSLPDLDIYRPLDTRQVVVMPDGESFILDYEGQRLLHHDANGNFIAEVAKAGQGPGEFQGTKELYRVGNRLYAESWFNVQTFDLKGRFIKTYKHEALGKVARKVADGWIIRKESNSERIHSVHWRDERFENDIKIVQWAAVPSSTKVTKNLYQVNPFPDQLQMTMSQDSELVYLKVPGRLDIQVFDVSKRAVVSRFPLETVRVPFSADFGDKLFKLNEKYFAKSGMKIQKEYPEFFPPVSGMFMTSEGAILLRQTTGLSKVRKWLVDGTGKPVASPFLEFYQFIEAIYGDWAYILTFDTVEESAGFARLPLKELKPVLGKQRQTYDLWRAENY